MTASLLEYAEPAGPRHFATEDHPSIRRLYSFIENLGDSNVSDVHVHPGKPVRRLIKGALYADLDSTFSMFSQQEIMDWIDFGTQGAPNPLGAKGHASIAFDTGVFRVRATFRRSTAGVTTTFRLIPGVVPNADSIGVPRQIQNLTKRTSGLVMVEGPTGSGKALALDTPIPTPSGWTTMAMLETGDQVFGRDGKAVRVTGLSEIKLNPELYRVHFSDGQSVEADIEHQWLVSTHHSRNHGRTKRRVAAIERLELRLKRADDIESLGSSALHAGSELTSQELYEVLVEHGLEGEWGSSNMVYQSLWMVDCPKRSVVRQLAGAAGSTRNGQVDVYRFEDAMSHLAMRIRQQRAHGYDIGPEQTRMSTGEILAAGVRMGSNNYANFAVPTAGALDLPEAELAIDPWLLGMWLGDGAAAAAAISSNEESGDMDLVRDRIEAFGFKTTPVGDHVTFRIKGLQTLLRQVGVLGNKHVPAAYLRASASQRLALLQGIMDSDGTVDKNGSCALALSNRTLVDGALELIRSLGIKASITYDRPSSYKDAEGDRVECKPHHLICFTTNEQVFTLPRKVVRLPETVRETQKWIYITDIEKIDSEPVRCITVDSDDHTYLAGAGFVATSNTTLLASLINKINHESDKHVYTVEDPIEFLHTEQGNSSIVQREIGVHASDYPTSIEDALRSKPNVIMVGEILNPATAKAALHAATTGHLVFSTAHAGSITEALDSFIGQFVAEEQPQIRSRLSSSLLAIVVQKLVPTVDGKLTAAREVLINNHNFSELIRDGKGHMIRAQIAGEPGCFTLENSLAALVQQGAVTIDEAMASAKSPDDLHNDLVSMGVIAASKQKP